MFIFPYRWGMATAEDKALKQIGRNVAKYRDQKRLTQEQLAEKANLDRMTIAFVETGLRFPRIDTFLALSKALGVPVKSFFDGV